MTDVEMSSLTPPSHKVNRPAQVTDQADELADDSMSNADALPNKGTSEQTTGSAPAQHVRRKRSVLSRKGKRLAHLQSRELVPARGLTPTEADDDEPDSYGTEDDEDEDEDEDSDRRRGTPSRIRSITKYAVNYILPNAVSPIPPQHAAGAAASSSGHPLDKPELCLGMHNSSSTQASSPPSCIFSIMSSARCREMLQRKFEHTRWVSTLGQN